MEYNSSGNEETLVVPEIKEAVSLKAWLEKYGPFSAKDFVDGMKCMFRGAKLLDSNGILHRDRHPANELVRRNHGGLEMFTIDTGSAVKKGDERNDHVQTTLAKFSSDPLVGGFFTDQIKSYGEDSEAYGLAFTALNTLTSQPPVLYDYRNGTAINNFTGESLLDEKGRVVPEKHKVAIDQAISQIPLAKRFALRNHLKWMRKALTLNQGERYTKLEDLFEDFDKACKPSKLSKLVRGGALGVAASGLIALGIAGSTVAYGPLARPDTQAVEQKSKIPIIPTFDGYKLETRNPLFSLNFHMRSKDKPSEVVYDTLSSKKESEGVSSRVEPSVSLERGKKYEIYLSPQQLLVLKSGLSGFTGKVYVEGLEGKTFNTDLIMADPTGYDMAGPNLPYDLSFEIPKEIQDGNYNLAVEIYAQNAPTGGNVIDGTQEINYEKWGKCIARKRVPVTVGNPSLKYSMSMLRLNSYMGGYFSIENQTISNKVQAAFPSGIEIELSCPEEPGFKSCYTNDSAVQSQLSHSFSVPNFKSEEERTLQVLVKNGTNIEGCTFFPIRTERMSYNTGSASYYSSIEPSPSKEWSDKLIGYRKAIYTSDATSSIDKR
ncbi:Protein kinase domain protein [uncultured archaeon]|nr:Protein kinase domain protein [uncultured archaeon]